MEFVYAIRKSNGVMFCMTREDYEKDKSNLKFVKSLDDPEPEPIVPEPEPLAPSVAEDFETPETIKDVRESKPEPVKHKKVIKKKVASKE